MSFSKPCFVVKGPFTCLLLSFSHAARQHSWVCRSFLYRRRKKTTVDVGGAGSSMCRIAHAYRLLRFRKDPWFSILLLLLRVDWEELLCVGVVVALPISNKQWKPLSFSATKCCAGTPVHPFTSS